VSASEAIAKLRETHKRWVNFDLSMLDEEAEIARSLPALLECAEALHQLLDDLGQLAPAEPSIQAVEEARAALQALAEGGGA